MPRPDTVICQYCGEPAPNTRRGQPRKYHVDCSRKVRAERVAEQRKDPKVRERINAQERERRKKRREDEQARLELNAGQRTRGQRFRDRNRVRAELEGEMIKCKIELGKASDALMSAAASVNDRVANMELRIAQIEARIDRLKYRYPSEEGGEDGQPEQPETKPSSIFDALR